MKKKHFTGICIPCPLCQDNRYSVVSELDRNGGTLRTVLCRQCGHVFTNPRPTEEEMNSFYQGHYRASYKGVTRPKLKHVYRAGLRALERVSDLEPYCNKGMRFLDIGSGGGEFVYLLHSLGYNAAGIEPNRGYAEFSQAEYGCAIKIGSVEDIANGEQAFNIITLHHVLEHLIDPVAVLKRIASILPDSGLLAVAVPNVEAQYHGPRRQYHLAHLHTFSIEGLLGAGHRAGLEAVKTMLQPETQHISVIFRKAFTHIEVSFNHSVALRIEASLRSYTPLRDTFSSRPYRKLWANITRPIREHTAMLRHGRPNHAKLLLDRLFEKRVNEASLNE